MVATFLSLTRFHIVLIASAGSLVFGWLLTGTLHPAMSALVGLDWFLINLMNRGADTAEDAVNAIEGAETAARHRRAIFRFAGVLLGASLVVHLFWHPVLVPVRVALHLLGFAYNFPLLRRGDGARARLKTVYGVKNTASCVGFLVTLFVYPAVAFELREGVDLVYVLLLAAYFAPFEYSFEVMYDLRDVRGDAALGVRTFPVVKGQAWSARLVVLLNVASLHVLVWGAAFGRLGLQEVILGVGPVVQLLLLLRGLQRGFTERLCTALTYLFFGMLAGYVVWVVTGMPLVLGFRPTPAHIVEVGLVVPGLLLWLALRGELGDRRFWATYAALAVAAWIGEQSAISLYHYYSYDIGGWHVLIGDVPLAVVLIWPMLLLSTRELLRRLGRRGGRAAFLGAGLTFLEATFVEVVCVDAGLWRWEGAGILGVPIIGVVGWSAFALGAFLTLEAGRVFLAPLAAPVALHLALPAVWHAGLSRVSSAALPNSAVLLGEGLVALVLGIGALRIRNRADIGMSEVLPRVAAAELILLLLPVAGASLSVVAFAAVFSLPYLALFRLR